MPRERSWSRACAPDTCRDRLEPSSLCPHHRRRGHACSSHRKLGRHVVVEQGRAPMATEGDKLTPFHFDRHAPEYINEFADITHELHQRCPMAWTETYGGHWVASGYDEVFEVARAGTLLSND